MNFNNFTAEKAKDIATKKEKELIDRQFSCIMELIKISAKSGKFKYTHASNVRGYLYEENIRKLSSLGYKICKKPLYGECYQEEISWI